MRIDDNYATALLSSPVFQMDKYCMNAAMHSFFHPETHPNSKVSSYFNDFSLLPEFVSTAWIIFAQCIFTCKKLVGCSLFCVVCLCEWIFHFWIHLSRFSLRFIQYLKSNQISFFNESLEEDCCMNIMFTLVKFCRSSCSPRSNIWIFETYFSSICMYVHNTIDMSVWQCSSNELCLMKLYFFLAERIRFLSLTHFTKCVIALQW